MRVTKLIGFFLSLLIFMFISCSHPNSGKSNLTPHDSSQTLLGLKEHNRGILPDTTGISSQNLQNRITEELNRERTAFRSRRVLEAVQVIQETGQALEALQLKNTAKALKLLTQAKKKLERLLVNYPEFKQLPVDASVEVINLASGPDTIKVLREKVKELVDNGQLQQARRILDNLVSEIRITTVYLPMTPFLNSLRNARALIKKGKPDMAMQVLSHSLSTLEIEENAIPLPVIIAEALVQGASTVADSSRDVALHMIKNARRQLEIAQLLGYSMNSREYQQLIDDLRSLQDELEKGEKTASLFEKLKKNIHLFKKGFSKVS